MASSSEDALLARYLIGQCSDAERERVEKDFFARDETFDRLGEIEEELIDRYHRGELSADERAAFEQAFASGARRDRALFKIALSRLSQEAHEDRATGQVPADDRVITSAAEPAWRRWMRFEPLGARLALAGATIVLAIAVAALVSRDAERQSSLEAVRRDAETLRQQLAASGQQAADWQNRAAALADQLSRNTQPSPSGAAAQPAPARLLATFVLAPGLTRGSRPPARIVVPQAVDTVRLQLALDGDPGHPQYRAEIRTAAGDVVWSEDGLQRRGSTSAPEVSVTLPAGLLKDGEHELILRGRQASSASVDEIASYFFVVTRR